METEKFISGYCRVLDGSRMVELILDGYTISQCDCSYGTCVYQCSCPIAKEIDALTNP